MGGGVPPPWPVMMDNTKPWDYYPRREDKREKERDRPRERTHDREREREHSPSAVNYTRSAMPTSPPPPSGRISFEPLSVFYSNAPAWYMRRVSVLILFRTHSHWRGDCLPESAKFTCCLLQIGCLLFIARVKRGQWLLRVSVAIVTRSVIATVSTRSAFMQSATATGRAERRRTDTERDGTERRTRGATNLLAGKPLHTAASHQD